MIHGLRSTKRRDRKVRVETEEMDRDLPRTETVESISSKSRFYGRQKLRSLETTGRA